METIKDNSFRLNLTRMGGKTNSSFHMEFNGSSVALRIPGKGTENYICRDAEAEILQILTNKNIAANVCFFDKSSGLLLTEFLDGYVTLTPEAFNSNELLEKAMTLLKKVHQIQEPFPSTFHPAVIVKKFDELIKLKQISLSNIGEYCREYAEDFLVRIDWGKLSMANCHCDLLANNFMYNEITGDLRLIDWEYGGRSFVLYDLADFAVDKNFSESRENAMLSYYFSSAIGEEEVTTFQMFKVISDYLWGLWALIQYADKDESYLYDYSTFRFERCRENINQFEMVV